MKKIFALLLGVLMVAGVCGCKGDTKDTVSKIVVEKPQFVAVGENGSRTDDAVGFQLENPEIGEEIVILKTNKGDIYIRLFPESAPITVTNFVTHCKNGYYDGLIFHRVIKDFMIQGGDPEATGAGGDSTWGADFEDEFNANLLNLRGSLSMANAGPGTNGSQFFINQKSTGDTKADYDYDAMYNKMYTLYKDQLVQEYNAYASYYGDSFKKEYPTTEEYVKEVIEYSIKQSATIDPNKVPEEVWELYKTVGGNISLDGAWREKGGHSVFGQVFKGMDVVDAIASVATNSSDKPVDTVIIEKAIVTTVTADMLS